MNRSNDEKDPKNSLYYFPKIRKKTKGLALLYLIEIADRIYFIMLYEKILTEEKYRNWQQNYR